MTEPVALKRTPLHAVHCRLGAKMAGFGGWDMPVQYAGILEEHHAVRRAAGLFDVSHMGEIEVRGPEALAVVESVTSNAASRLKTGQIQYSGLMNERGGFVDDILVHKVAGDHYFLCVNAANQEKDYEHIHTANRRNASVEFTSEQYAQIAIQGPRALEIVQKLTSTELAAIRYYWFADGEVADAPARIARTGYTGEDGCEIYIAPKKAVEIWETILETGRVSGLKPCGLGARNTLRLEAKMALYGHEIDDSTTPYEADLGWIVRMDKGEFLGRAALECQLREGVPRKLIGFEMRGRGIGRDGYEVLAGGQPAGRVTSGGPSPTLGKNIGLCYLPAGLATIGRAIEVVVRNQPVEAETVPTPFYKRAK